jgi:hypothetical protein
MATNGTKPGVTTKRPTKAPYPEDSDKIVRENAQLYHPEAIGTLDAIRNQLFGNSDKVYDFALAWGTNKVMSNDRTEIQAATNNLAGYWSGRACDQYNTFASAATGVMATNQQQIGYICNTLGDCVALVYDTYASGIKLVGHTAQSIASCALGAVLAPVPGVGEAAMIVIVIRLLSDFMGNFTDLFAEAETTMGGYAKEGAYFVGYASSYAAPAGGTNVLDQTDGWTVKPEDSGSGGSSSTGTTTVTGRG